jgi:hypothetical protein
VRHQTTYTLCLILLALICCGCPQRPKLPLDPGLAGEDLGLGLKLGISVDAAREIAQRQREQCEIVVLSREELNGRAPYDSQDNPQDRVLAIYLEPAEAAEGQPSGVNQPAVLSELRCYLADPANSVVTLGGMPAAKLTEEQLSAKYGPPVQRTATGDAEVHLTYYFELEDQPEQMIELVASFNAGGTCFALSLALQPRL